MATTQSNNSFTPGEKFKLKTGGSAGTEEWLYKEEGSYEDHDCAPDHVFAILEREMSKPYMELTIEEAQTLFKSISYHVSAGWDVFDSPLRERAIKNTWRGYYNRLAQLLEKAGGVK